ncbi:AAA+ ATPase superfamily predicted ATPase [Kitasatospora sp. MAA4]|uniref:AAA family ATPase n=1 Tax=Kitasatospora sp. MAA4 TaxID=3035093 RepID=UPI002475065E|nr:ATP-binding protein [Kitasatospora sp. MAA4]MDH6134995.1 AAA+ ATPase superfamily predicted ATPase [Kitasatospora sp. MAA4]
MPSTSIPKPARVMGRDQEWSSLTRFLQRGGPALHIGLLSGRRRHGKSFLLRALAEATGGLYVTAVQEEGRLAAQQRFTAALAGYAGLPAESVELDDWQQILTTALELVERRRAVGALPLLIIDELPYLLDHSPEIPSLLQHLYDDSQAGQAPGGRLVLCGSAMSVMTELLSGNKALRGRAALDMRLGPFDYRAAGRFWEVDEPAVALRLHAVLGGAPGYRQLVQDAPPSTLAEFDDWVVENLLDPDLGLFTRNETEHLLREDPRITRRTLYYDILTAVAGGAGTPTKIGGVIGRERTALAHPLSVLESAGYLRRAQDLLHARNPTISVTDPIIRFNQLITVPYSDLLDRREARQVWEAARATFASQILGPHFEELARTWTREFAGAQALDGRLVGAVGTTAVHDAAGRAKHEVDVVALAPGQRPGASGAGILLLGEAKATLQRRTPGDIERLERIRQLLTTEGHQAEGAMLTVFSLTGFSPELEQLAARREDVLLVGIDMLYGR